MINLQISLMLLNIIVCTSTLRVALHFPRSLNLPVQFLTTVEVPKLAGLQKRIPSRNGVHFQVYWKVHES
jgi:hypothetical protein